MASKSGSTLSALSADIAALVQQVGKSVVRVDDGTRLTATGIVWTADGLIVSTSHGVETDEGVVIEFFDGARHPATVVGRDEESDIAVLKIDAVGFEAIPRAGVDDAQVGQLAVAVGRPGDRGLSSSLGMIGARIEAESNGSPEYVLHTDATLYRGFSGGAFVNTEGNLIGLLNLSMGRHHGVALGTSMVEHVVDQILAEGSTKRGYLGVTTQPAELSGSLRSTLGIEQEYGLLIINVGEGSPAEQSGILQGDIVLAIEGKPVDSPDRMRRRLRKFSSGQVIAITLVRGGQKTDISATLGESAE